MIFAKDRLFVKKSFLFLFICFTVIFFGCKSVKENGQGTDAASEPQVLKTTLTKYPDVMLWRLDGYSSEGEPSTVYMLGTYHAGDERISVFPEAVQNAIDNSDRFCCELSKSDWEQLPQMMNDLTMQSFLTDLSHTFIDDLTQDEIILISTFIDQQTQSGPICGGTSGKPQRRDQYPPYNGTGCCCPPGPCAWIRRPSGNSPPPRR